MPEGKIEEFYASDPMEPFGHPELNLDFALAEKSMSKASPLPSFFDEIESHLMMEDDVIDHTLGADEQYYDQFLSEILVGSPPPPSSETLSLNSSDTASPDECDAKKKMRQLRNRDSAFRSRERKKTYVKDLEDKSKFLEGECRRLSRLLHCYVAENQHLRLSLAVTSTKQESAVLLLESLLLGSLLWYLVTVSPPHPALGGNAEERAPKEVHQRKANNNAVRLPVPVDISRRCKASRTRIKYPPLVHLLV